jgi:hypothetical protein
MNAKVNPWAMSAGEEAMVKLQEFSQEAGGVMRLYLVRHDNPEIGPAVRRGEPLAITLALTINKALTGLVGTGRRCISCEHVFVNDPPDAFLIWVPNIKHEEPENLIAQAICPTCCRGKNDNQLLHDALVYIKQIFPDTEEIEEASEFIDCGTGSHLNGTG